MAEITGGTTTSEGSTVVNVLPPADAIHGMEPILHRGNGDSPRVERSTLVLVVMAAMLLGIVFLLLTSGTATA